MASSSAQQWVDDDLSTLDLGHERRNRGARQMIEGFAQRPGASLSTVFEDRAEIAAGYRLLNNDAVAPAQIRAALLRGTVGRLAAVKVVLVPQDTTCLDFRGHPAAKGLGPTGGPKGSVHGLFMHSALAVSAEGVPLGLLHQQDWARDPAQAGSKHQRKQRRFEEKESYRWLHTVQAVEAALPDDKLLIQIADRERDIYEVLAAPRRAGSHVLIRAYRECRLEDEGARLWPTVAAQSVAQQFELLVHEGPQRTVRTAQLQLCFCLVTLRPPRNGVHNALEPIMVTAIEVRESGAPERATPVLWRLLTDLPVDDVADARQCVHYYERRWLIERFHFTLKGGCHIEESQLRTIAGLERLLALFSAVVLWLLWMTYSARGHPHASCTVAFTDAEWQVLYRYYNAQPPPDQPPTLSEAVLWLARLGRFMGRKGDGKPGVKVLWCGILRLHDVVAGFLLAHPDVCNAQPSPGPPVVAMRARGSEVQCRPQLQKVALFVGLAVDRLLVRPGQRGLDRVVELMAHARAVEPVVEQVVQRRVLPPVAVGGHAVVEHVQRVLARTPVPGAVAAHDLEVGHGQGCSDE